MTVAAAQKFIRRIQAEEDLVSQINSAPNEPAVQHLLSDLELQFNYDQFEQAYHLALTQCQTQEHAEHIKDIKLWWDYLGYSFSQ